jgi:hypothetical protein
MLLYSKIRNIASLLKINYKFSRYLRDTEVLVQFYMLVCPVYGKDVMMGQLPLAHKPLTRNSLLCAQSAVRFCDMLQHRCEEALLPHLASCYSFVFCYWRRKSEVLLAFWLKRPFIPLTSTMNHFSELRQSEFAQMLGVNGSHLQRYRELCDLIVVAKGNIPLRNHVLNSKAEIRQCNM